jgi:hypothetical protein
MTEHNTCMELQHGRLNHVFEMAGVLCQPHLEPIACVSKKRQAAATVAQVSAPKKTTEKRKHTKGSSHSGGQTSEQEGALAKPMKQSKKFKAQSSGLSITEKVSSAKVVIRPIAGIKIGRENLPSTSAAGGSAGRASTHAIDTYALSASDEETILPEPR